MYDPDDTPMYDTEGDLMAEIEALKITNRTLQEQLDRLSAPSAEPVAWRLSNPDSEYCITSYNKEQADGYISDGWKLVEVLYTAPPNLSAAVAAAREQDAKVCDGLATLWTRENVGFDKGYTMAVQRAAQEIRALQTENGMKALQEFGKQTKGEDLDGPIRGLKPEDDCGIRYVE